MKYRICLPWNGFFATHVYLWGNLPVRLATQRKSLRKFNLRPTCDYLPVRLTRALNASVKSGNSFHAFHADVLLTLAKETRGRVSSSDWMKHRECPRCLRPKKRAGGIHTDVLDIFPHPQTNPDGCRWIRGDHHMSWKSPINMTRTSISTVRTKTCLHPASSPCWTWTAILVSAPRWRSHLFISLEPILMTTDSSEVMFTSLFSGNWKFETLLVRRVKSSFLFVLSRRNAFYGLEESWFTSLVESLILFALHISQTMSTRLLDWRWFRMNRMKTFPA